MLTDAQRVLLEDKLTLWGINSHQGNMDLRDYNRRAAEALKAALDICSAGNVSEGLVEALTMTGCRDAADLIDMANVGRSLMDRVGELTGCTGAVASWAHWAPADDPAEIVNDLINALDDVLTGRAQGASEGVGCPSPPSGDQPAVSEEAVEAAARKMRHMAMNPRPDSDWDEPGRVHDDNKDLWRAQARTILTAAAPFMMGDKANG